MKVAVGSNNPVKKQAVHNTFSKVLGRLRLLCDALIQAYHHSREVMQL